jgi:phosphoenolpyruvate synthase/pyruvate phosphate dikinase
LSPSELPLVLPLSDPMAIAATRVGPKAATLARLAAAGLPVPEGFSLTDEAYRRQLRAGGSEDTARGVAGADPDGARRQALAVRLSFLREPFDATIERSLTEAWAGLTKESGPLVAVRSSALCEDVLGASFAGQFDTFLGIADRDDLITAVRACWASLWATRALRYMRAHGADPADTAMAVLVQRMIEARAAGGALSRTPEDDLMITGTWGLGSAVAQGEVVPDRFILSRTGKLVRIEPGRKDRLVAASAAAGTRWQAVPRNLSEAPCLSEREAETLAGMILEAEAVLGTAVELEWAKDEQSFFILQARPLPVEARRAEDDLWRRHPGLRGQPSGIGWATGPACVVLHEHDLEHVGVGDVLVTQVAGPALTVVLPRVAAVVAELGGSTSHLAALARERGIPAVLGALEATRRIPSGATVAVDGVAGVVRWRQ